MKEFIWKLINPFEYGAVLYSVVVLAIIVVPAYRDDYKDTHNFLSMIYALGEQAVHIEHNKRVLSCDEYIAILSRGDALKNPYA